MPVYSILIFPLILITAIFVDLHIRKHMTATKTALFVDLHIGKHMTATKRAHYMDSAVRSVQSKPLGVACAARFEQLIDVHVKCRTNYHIHIISLN